MCYWVEVCCYSSHSAVLDAFVEGSFTSTFLDVFIILQSCFAAAYSHHPSSKVAGMMVLQRFLCLSIIFLCCNPQPVIFEQGVFEIETLSIPGLTTDSATVLTLSGPSITQTRLLPVWHCTTRCSNKNYGIIVTPPAATGNPGNVYPPPGYVVRVLFFLFLWSRKQD